MVQDALATEVIDPIADPRWHELVTASPGSGVFHHPAWLRILRDEYRYPIEAWCVERRDGTVVAGLPVATVRSRLTGARLVAVPFSGSLRSALSCARLGPGRCARPVPGVTAGATRAEPGDSRGCARGLRTSARRSVLSPHHWPRGRAAGGADPRAPLEAPRRAARDPARGQRDASDRSRRGLSLRSPSRPDAPASGRTDPAQGRR
jgi:hypothetical protein